VGGFLAGAYIAFGGLVAIAVSSGLDPEVWATLPTLFAGTVFALGLVLVVLAGSEPAGMTYERLAQIAELKGTTESADEIFLRALGCNWLVCLAVWVAMSAEDTAGKILGIFFPIMAFVAIGFDHVVANMFFLPAATFAEVPGIGWGDAPNNWLWAFLGNLAGAAIFVSSAYWFLYLRDTDEDDDVGPSGAEPEQTQAGNGRARTYGPLTRRS
jgi:formate transporter